MPRVTFHTPTSTPYSGVGKGRGQGGYGAATQGGGHVDPSDFMRYWGERWAPGHDSLEEGLFITAR